MLLRSIRLENIRSYTNHEVTFPKGSTLLGGDIGSGKSSILLAIEFALFGIRRKHLDGNSLLRHGKNNGSVELKFSIDKKDVIIKRTLKRGKDKVEQDSGYVIIDDVKKQATAVELKSIILDILGYPKELITKTKNLVYRYTVYTPQEEMKEILIEEEEARLDTLRKVFGIDRYKRIGENCLIVTRNIKEKRKELSGKMSDLENMKQQKEEAKKEIKEIEHKFQALLPQAESAKIKVQKNKEEIKEIEDNIKSFNALKKDIEILNIEESNKHSEFERNKRELEETENKLVSLKKEVEGKEIVNVDSKIQEKEKNILMMEKRIMDIKSRINEFKIKKNNAENIKNKILKISRCPTCEQEVSKEHKDDITRRENYAIEDCSKGSLEMLEKDKEIENKLQMLRQEAQNLRKIKSEASVIEFKLKEIKEKRNRREMLLNNQKEAKRKIGEIFAKKNEFNEKIKQFESIEEIYSSLKVKLDESLEKEKQLAIEKRGMEERKNGIQRTLEMIEEEIKSKIEAKERWTHLGEMLNWLENGFIKLTATMEKQVMLTVYHEFNELFQRWFDMLIEDESLNVRLDDSFTPIIEQNGYEVSIVHLSGGERTSAALAYRLALNKVVNDLMSGIKTKDLIILDEPTDGFSSEQLDRVREVLEQIGVKQTIIVSHESKIESFVDNVVKINKNEHVSGVI